MIDIRALAQHVLDTAVPSPSFTWDELDLRTKRELTLAHAVLDLIGKVERVEALADKLDAETNRMGSRRGGSTARAFTAEIRNALNGAHHD